MKQTEPNTYELLDRERELLGLQSEETIDRETYRLCDRMDDLTLGHGQGAGLSLLDAMKIRKDMKSLRRFAGEVRDITDGRIRHTRALGNLAMDCEICGPTPRN